MKISGIVMLGSYNRNVLGKIRIDCEKSKIGSADLRQFIRYLYEYENGHRIRNVGFVKVEEKDISTTIHIHGKGLRLNLNESLKLYIFYMDENVCRGIWQGDLTNVNPAVNYRLIFTAEDTGRPENFDQIEGIILEREDGRKFAAVWDDREIDVNSMRLWDEIIEMPTNEEIDKYIAPTNEEIDKYIAPTKPQFQKISREDLAKLPRCEWRLANNSFLLHGYHNFHHLILTEDDMGFWLGVPGIYHEREAKAAEAFGFSRFLHVEDEVDFVELASSEQFGYWCRQVRRGMNENHRS